MKEKPIRILHVEDDETFIELVDMMLSDKHFKVDVARNGVEAIDMAFKDIHNIILMDIKMPIMDGREASIIIKKTLSHIPVIAVTAYDVNLKEDSFFDDILRKPFTRKKLQEKILEHYLKS